MNAILALQKLMNTDPIVADSTQSICCYGSTNSMRECCNAGKQS